MRKPDVILLVEDDPVDVKAVKRALSGRNVRNPLHVVGDGIEALEYLRHEGAFTDPESAPRPSLILMDLKMPRMDGLECLQELKADADLCIIPVVIFTSSSDEIDVLRSYRNGAASYIVKPITFEGLMEAIATFDLYWTLSELP